MKLLHNFSLRNSLLKSFILSVFILSTTFIKSQLFINEVMPSNVSVRIDDLYDFPDSWIELYNSGTETINIKGYSFTDKSSDITKWTVPVNCFISPKGYKLIYFDKENIGLHANFRLDINGGTISMYSPDRKLVDKFSYTKEAYNTSFARVPDGGQNTGPVTIASPLISNNNKVIAKERCEKPVINIEGNFFSSSVRIKVTCSTPGAVVRYSSTGEEPFLLSARFPEAGLEVKTNKVYKFKAFASDKLASETTVKSFFIDSRVIDLPIVSLSVDKAHLTNDSIGIYVIGTNGIIDNCTNDPRNYNQPWRRPANIEIFESSHVESSIINQTCELRIAGGCSRNFPQKSLILYSNKRFGNKNFKYQFFQDKPGIDIKSFMIRNTGNDFYHARLRDPFIQSVVAKNIDIDYQAYAPAVLFINGEYYGIQNLRERSNEDYVLSNYGYEEEDIDLMSLEVSDIITSVGDNKAYNDLIKYADENDISIDENYQNLTSKIDVEEYVNYMFTEIFSGNRDWPGNNCKLWRPRTVDGKWRWILMDTDFGFGYENLSTTHNTLLYALGELPSDTWMNPQWSTILFKNLMQNDKFKELFINRAVVSMGDYYQEENIRHISDSLVSKIIDEADFHASRWWTPKRDEWLSKVEFMTYWPVRRKPRMFGFIKDKYNLQSPKPVIINTNLPQGNRKAIELNDFVLSQHEFNGELFPDYDINLKALDVDGYEFDYWKINKIYNSNSTTSISRNPVVSYKFTESINGYEVMAMYKEKEILSLIPVESKNNFSVKLLSDKVMINYDNNISTSLDISLYSLDGILIAQKKIEEKDTSFRIYLDYLRSSERVFILKCKTDTDSYSFKLLK